MAGLVLTTLMCEIVLFAQCQPLKAYWNQKPEYCWDPTLYGNFIWGQVGTGTAGNRYENC